MSAIIPLFIIMAHLPCWGEVSLNDPGIPHGEKLVYDQYIDSTPSVMTEETRIIEKDGRQVYDIVSHSRLDKRRILIEKKTMIVLQTEVLQKGDDAVVKRVNTLVEKKQPLKGNEIGVINYYAINYLFRAVPFEQQDRMILKILGTQGAMEMEVSVSEKETITVNEEKYECWHLRFGMAGMLGRLLPKASFWYTVKAPHYLVKYEGLVSGPGSPKKVLELKSYTTP